MLLGTAHGTHQIDERPTEADHPETERQLAKAAALPP